MADSDTTRILAMAENGRYELTDVMLALGAWETWHHHPMLREDLFDGTLDMTNITEILTAAGFTVPWPT